MEEGKCGGRGKCKICKKNVENVAYHQTVCKKPVKYDFNIVENIEAKSDDVEKGKLVTKYYIDSNDDFKIKKTKTAVDVDKIKISRMMGKFDYSYSTHLFATKEEAHERLIEDHNLFIDSNKREIGSLRKQLAFAEQQLEENIAFIKKIKSRKS